ncbi:glycosyltransferase family 4 protein [Amycolatopsis sp. WAC 01376]|uniref:glycosyltransferase family 4 protein n=1 Tax=Amycolatopsis sp. WAC 01376 TaxID=2203195 RepID=UPI000F7A4C12|nr:glycosyltransferase family 4 protein [Amycolatopsis sp. WAC 01376]
MTSLPDVLVVFGGYGRDFAGAERMAWRTLERLARPGRRVAVLTDSVGATGEHRPRAVPVFGSEADLRRALPGWRPSVVHAFDLALPAWVEAAAELADRYRATFALTPASAVQVWPEPETGAALCRRADVLFTLNETENTVLTGYGVPPWRIRAIPHAADLVGTPDASGFRRRYGVDGRMVLFAGRRTASKGYRRLLAATGPVWERLPDTWFAFIGPNADADAEAAFLANAAPRLLDLGMVDEQTKHDALAACDLLCLPTVADVFPLVFVEAWTCGRPVVSGDFPGVDDVLRPGVDGLVAGPGPSGLATTLIDALRDEKGLAAMGQAALLRASREFGWDKVAAAVEDGYGSAIGRTG